MNLEMYSRVLATLTSLDMLDKYWTIFKANEMDDSMVEICINSNSPIVMSQLDRLIPIAAHRIKFILNFQNAPMIESNRLIPMTPIPSKSEQNQPNQFESITVELNGNSNLPPYTSPSIKTNYSSISECDDEKEETETPSLSPKQQEDEALELIQLCRLYNMNNKDYFHDSTTNPTRVDVTEASGCNFEKSASRICRQEKKVAPIPMQKSWQQFLHDDLERNGHQASGRVQEVRTRHSRRPHRSSDHCPPLSSLQ